MLSTQKRRPLKVHQQLVMSYSSIEATCTKTLKYDCQYRYSKLIESWSKKQGTYCLALFSRFGVFITVIVIVAMNFSFIFVPVLITLYKKHFIKDGCELLVLRYAVKKKKRIYAHCILIRFYLYFWPRRLKIFFVSTIFPSLR